MSISENTSVGELPFIRITPSELPGPEDSKDDVDESIVNVDEDDIDAVLDALLAD